jgi:multidrug transporter EmrE-like cation transporter
VSDALAQGVPAALAAGVLYNIAPLIETAAARESGPGTGLGLRLVGSLLARPLWVAGLGCELLGYGSQVLALTVAPLVLVEPIIASGIVVLVLGGGRLLGERVTRRGGVAIGLLTIGTVLLTVAFGGRPDTGVLAPSLDLWLISFGCAAGASLLYALGLSAERHRSLMLCGLAFGAAAGACYGVTGVETRQLSLLVHHFSLRVAGRVLSTPTPYLLIVFGIVALGLLQRGYQRGSPATVVPTMTAVATSLTVAGGVVVFGEKLPPGATAFASAVVGMAAILLGVVSLVSQPSFLVLSTPKGHD